VAVLTIQKALDEYFEASGAHALEPREEALARAIATATLRHLGSIKRALDARLTKGLPSEPRLFAVLATGAAQILYLGVPDHAAVDLAVTLVRADRQLAPLGGLVNAVLRRIAREQEQILAEADPLGGDTPAWLARRWIERYGEADARRIAAAHGVEPAVDLTVKADPEVWAERLGGFVLPTGSVRLVQRTPIRELPGYDEGAWWVQDAAAALPARLLRAEPGERVADLCAAPGGKTAQLAATGARVTAVERSQRRIERLRRNLERLGLAADARVADVLAFADEPFDAVLLDAPCSATGTIRRHPDVAWTKRESDVIALAGVQSALLDRAAALVRPGGRLVFSTCSLEPEEGERQVEAFLARHEGAFRRDPVEADEIPGIAEFLTPLGELRTLPFHFEGGSPGRAGGVDGFFAARLLRDRA
jgi:16S rRNA (cytosine967-C5)-methyltransferase